MSGRRACWPQEKEAFRDLEAAATEAHFARNPCGRTQTAETSAMRLDVLRDLKRVNDHTGRGRGLSGAGR